ncbi:MAG: CYTH domain-containing protein [Paludibacteraceae bacterium]|nr:CYTH domain-containing protein [Paludibacteraceae bacterium]
MIEIERKFLAANESWRHEISKTYRITQGYMCADKLRTVRIRIRDNEAFITIKGKSSDGGLSRYEWEKQIYYEDGIALLSLCDPRKIDKYRHEVIYDGKLFEIDEFVGDNEGLILIEVELMNVNEQFNAPEWLGMEVTGDFRFYNSFLTKKPFQNWS